MQNVSSTDYKINLNNGHIDIEEVKETKSNVKGLPIFKESIEIIDKIDRARNFLIEKVFDDLDKMRKHDILINGDILRIITYTKGRLLTVEAFIILNNTINIFNDEKEVINQLNEKKSYFKGNDNFKKSISIGNDFLSKLFDDNISKKKTFDFKIEIKGYEVEFKIIDVLKESKKTLLFKTSMPVFYINDKTKTSLLEKATLSLLKCYKNGLIENNNKIRFTINIVDGLFNLELFVLDKELQGIEYTKKSGILDETNNSLTELYKEYKKKEYNKYSNNNIYSNYDKDEYDMREEKISKLYNTEYNLINYAKGKIKSLHEELDVLLDNNMYDEASFLVEYIDSIRREFFTN